VQVYVPLRCLQNLLCVGLPSGEGEVPTGAVPGKEGHTNWIRSVGHDTTVHSSALSYRTVQYCTRRLLLHSGLELSFRAMSLRTQHHMTTIRIVVMMCLTVWCSLCVVICWTHDGAHSGGRCADAPGIFP